MGTRIHRPCFRGEDDTQGDPLCSNYPSCENTVGGHFSRVCESDHIWVHSVCGKPFVSVNEPTVCPYGNLQACPDVNDDNWEIVCQH